MVLWGVETPAELLQAFQTPLAHTPAGTCWQDSKQRTELELVGEMHRWK